ncbi:MAG: bifunctional 4-hydroxy-2-oxoglutarate aldolase/2-dehydro-3-deoxy-phosphogluconate aldolase [Verrucomicrobia bacterium]|nr:bifunctional 4-hydroxy-2-oxoglutarate aldolase/2-dehydro-3-deoxy-phosphogluconate aldolase [Verrucomicrobiota bacterium]MBV9657836.1 bifunctional 4-hydroxy-2-oxoglutarate aldolase/2-dehydro-3-deoxy-phosphogluconate aldolase [Verrucomicrobiota bacterium]
MVTKPQIIDRILHPGIVAVIRTDSAAQLLPICEALVAGGVIGLEITMTTPDAIDAIATASRQFGDRALVGVGTVIDTETCRAAILAGAQFVVTPVCRPEIVQMSLRYGKPIACGAYTPTEALTAHEAGADFIKLFPADGLGPQYIKNLLAPLPMLRIIPTGGVTVETAGDFLRAGCAALAAGSSLVAKDFVQKQDWSALTQRARAFVEAVAKARGA